MNIFIKLGFNFDTSVLSDEEKKKFNGTIDYLKVPKLSEIALKFKSEDEFKDYVEDKDYTRGDRVYLAISLNSFSDSNYDYLIRYNMSDDSPNFQFSNSILNTWGREIIFDDIDKFIYMQYKPDAMTEKEKNEIKRKASFSFTQSFLTLQNAIDKMIINHKVTASELSDAELFIKFYSKSYLVKKDRVFIYFSIII